MLSHPSGRHHTGGGMTRARGDDAGGGTMHEDTTEGGQHRGGQRSRGDDTEGGDDIRQHHRGWDNMWCPPCCPPSPASSSLQCDVSQEGGTTCGVPRVVPLCPHHPPFSVVSPRRVGQHVVSPVLSPLTRVIPPSVWCLLGGVGQHVVSPASSPFAHIVPPCPCRPPFSVVSPRRVGQHVVSPMSSPLTRIVPLQCDVSQEGGTTCGVPHVIPPCPRHPPFSVVSPRRVGQHVVSPVSSPLACVIPSSVWCFLGGVGQHVVSPVSSPPCPRRPPLPVLSPLDYFSISSQINGRSNRQKLG